MDGVDAVTVVCMVDGRDVTLLAGVDVVFLMTEASCGATYVGFGGVNRLFD